MLKNNSLKNAKYSLAFSLTIAASSYAAENVTTSDSVTPPVNSPPKNDEIKWAPLEINKPEQIDTSQIDTHQKRELWEARLSELNTYYQKLRQQAQADGIEFSNIPPWDEENKNLDRSSSAMQNNLERMQAVINGMTPEERDVCTTVHRLSVGLMQSSSIPPPQPIAEPNYGGGPRYGYGYPDEYRRIPNGYGNYGGGYGRPYAYPNYVPDWQGGAGSWW